MKKYIKETFECVRADVRAYWKGIVWAIVLIIVHIVILSKYLMSICPVVWITGYPCPACGLTRAGICILRGEFIEAWELHPFIYVIIFFTVAVVICRYLFHRKAVKWMKIALVVGTIAMVLYYIYRFYRYFPDQQPSVYCPNNLLNLTRLFLYRIL